MKDIPRPPKELIESLYKVSSATASGILSHKGIRDPFMQGPVCRTPEPRLLGLQ